jgi:SAM-dependent methyltransferase
MWWGSIRPRIHAFLPSDTILEIGPGFGRLTQYLKDLCKNLIVVDLTAKCIEGCKHRFIGDDHIAYHVNDGKSLEMVADQSLDFVFSFASLVHAESDVLTAYLSQLAHKLKPNGVGFFHHSNLKECIPLLSCLEPSEQILSTAVLRGHWRGASVSAQIFEHVCDQVGLQCIAQELINWTVDLPLPMDCFSFFTPKASIWARPNVIYTNFKFIDEIRYQAKLSHLYCLNTHPSEAKEEVVN